MLNKILISAMLLFDKKKVSNQTKKKLWNIKISYYLCSFAS